MTGATDVAITEAIAGKEAIRDAKLGHVDELAERIKVNPAVVNYVHEGFLYSPLVAALVRGHVGAAELLLRHGADPNLRGLHGWSPLMTLVMLGEPMVEFLLDNGADVNATTDSAVGDRETALHVAARCHCAALLPILLAAGARTDARNAKGQTPLELAKTTRDTLPILQGFVLTKIP